MTEERIYARHCRILPVEKGEANAFIAAHHRQGVARVATKLLSIGLYYQGNLVGVAQYCVPRTPAKARQYSTELLRLAFPVGVRVVGGASKLLKHHIRHYKPSDVFTYQDMSGVGSAVYAESGFTLVSQAKKKTYLVAPGKTLATASRKEALSISYATRYGPDRITGSKLGEVYRLDGSRKTNPELFLEDLGWRAETTAGDRVWEWTNPDITYYVYKITATDSDKYYIGVSHVKKASASSDECEAAFYWGSGGPKFKHWRTKHASTLGKEIVKTFSRKAPAFTYEADLLGDSFQTDPLCLNVTAGGAGSVGNQAVTIELRYCNLCLGETKHKGRSCYVCLHRDIVKTRFCSVCERDTKHRGNTCCNCSVAKSSSVRFCSVCEAETNHRGSSCVPCKALRTDNLSFCLQCDGKTLHRGSSCIPCGVRRSMGWAYCARCETKTSHHSGSCYNCSNQASVSEKFCDACNEITKHGGESCYQCRTRGAITMQHCPICLKDTKHKGTSCCSCSARRMELNFCSVCNAETNHRGSSCRKCLSRKTAHTRFHQERSRPDCLLCNSDPGVAP